GDIIPGIPDIPMGRAVLDAAAAAGVFAPGMPGAPGTLRPGAGTCGVPVRPGTPGRLGIPGRDGVPVTVGVPVGMPRGVSLGVVPGLVPVWVVGLWPVVPACVVLAATV